MYIFQIYDKGDPVNRRERYIFLIASVKYFKIIA